MVLFGHTGKKITIKKNQYYKMHLEVLRHG